ncbi:MAG: helicase-related protein [Crenarchaeota archaeon]|nr:helicase-related protein [Thermoproteota archaeon]MDW8033970.1 ERCC4 domain-containing protein [Nitrososphaerota archaeon]
MSVYLNPFNVNSEGFVEHPLIKDGKIRARNYQLDISCKALTDNTLVVLPTGLGKTVIALLVVAEKLRRNEGVCVIMAPTKPLIEQHYQFFKDCLKIETSFLVLWTGETPSRDRVFKSYGVIFATPQLFRNEILKGRVQLNKIVLMVFDEAHRAKGNYAYITIAQRYQTECPSPLILGLTASPGSKREDIEVLMKNLFIKNLEFRTRSDKDVAPYVKKIDYKLVPIPLSPLVKEARSLIQSFISEQISQALKVFPWDKKPKSFSEITEMINAIKSRPFLDNPDLLEALKSLARARYLITALERLDLLGSKYFLQFVSRLIERTKRPGSPKYLAQIVNDKRILDAIELLKLHKDNAKLSKLIELSKREFEFGVKRIIVFVSYRAASKEVEKELSSIEGFKVARLIGQASRTGDRGQTQKEQEDIISRFRRGEFNILIATQVGEEGLDISSSDTIIFYDNTPSGIRFIQRVGRTGRNAPGKVYILYFQGTRDEQYLWIARRREKKMVEEIKTIRSQVDSSQGSSFSLTRFIEEDEKVEEDKVSVVVDSRESNSPVVEELARLGAKIIFSQLEVGDYVLSERICVERKTVNDFASSIIDSRLFHQAKFMTDSYEIPILLIEGKDIYATLSNIRPSSIRGALAAVITGYRMVVLWSRDPKESAELLYAIALREQKELRKRLQVRGEKKPESIADQQVFLLSGLPLVERSTAIKLLKYFKTPLRIFTASEQELQQVEGIGDVKARKIREVLTREFKEDELTR